MCLTPRAGCSTVGAATRASRHILPKGIPGGVCVTWGKSWNPTEYLTGWHCLEISLGRAAACTHHSQSHPSRHHLTTLLGPPPCLRTENHPRVSALFGSSADLPLSTTTTNGSPCTPSPNVLVMHQACAGASLCSFICRSPRKRTQTLLPQQHLVPFSTFTFQDILPLRRNQLPYFCFLTRLCCSLFKMPVNSPGCSANALYLRNGKSGFLETFQSRHTCVQAEDSAEP